jgi:hypothetical protein
VNEAWEVAKDAQTLRLPERTFLQVPYHYSCSVYAVGALAAIANGLVEEGHQLLYAAEAGCPSGVYDEPPNFLQYLKEQLSLVAKGGKSTLAGHTSKVESIVKPQSGFNVKAKTTNAPSTTQVQSGHTLPVTNSATSTLSGAVKGIRAARTSSNVASILKASDSRPTPVSPVQASVVEPSNSMPSLESMHNEFWLIAQKW